MTIKKCPPFIDAMTFGFLMPLVADLKVEDGEFSWVSNIPVAKNLRNLTRSPIDYHDSVQVKGTPFFDDDRFIIKFNNFWTIELPPGYSLFVTHPVNRADLPFTTLTGLVNSDLYVDSLIHFPARWHDQNFNGVVPKGTPVAQCIASNGRTGLNNLMFSLNRPPSAYSRPPALSPRKPAFTAEHFACRSARSARL